MCQDLDNGNTEMNGTLFLLAMILWSSGEV